MILNKILSWGDFQELPYYEYQLLYDDWVKMRKEEEERNRKQEEQQKAEYDSQKNDFKSIMPDGLDSFGQKISY